MASTLEPTPMIPFIQNYLAQHRDDINFTARSLGVPATAIASAVAQEMSEIYHQTYVRGGVPITTESFRDQYLDNRALSNSAQQIADDFAAREADIRSGSPPNFFKKYWEKFWNPTADDAGPGNVNLGSAILSLKRYLADPANASDPLDLKKYGGDYHLLANDLISLDSPATFSFAGLAVKQGYDNLARIFGPAFTNASEADQAALLTTYYKQGLNTFLESHQNFVANPDGSVSPSPANKGGFDPLPNPAAGDGGPFVYRNFDKIKSAVGSKQGSSAAPSAPASDAQGQTTAWAKVRQPTAHRLTFLARLRRPPYKTPLRRTRRVSGPAPRCAPGSSSARPISASAISSTCRPARCWPKSISRRRRWRSRTSGTTWPTTSSTRSIPSAYR